MNRPPTTVRLALAGRTSTFGSGALAILALCAAAACAPTPAPSQATSSAAAGSASGSVAAPTTHATPADATPADATPAQPPVARLAVPPAPATAGALGSYTWLGAGSDSPWLPGAAVSLPPGRVASVTFEPSLPFVSWRARTGTASGDGLQLLAEGGGRPVEFVVPVIARTVELTVDYGSAGSVTWYWAVTPVP